MAVAPLITLIIDNPLSDDDSYGVPMCRNKISNRTTGADVVWEVIDQLKIPVDKINVVPMVRCHTKEKITDDHIAKCLPYLWEDLRKNKPAIAVCMGAIATKALLNIKKLGSARGMYTKFSLAKNLPDLPEDMADLLVTATVAPGAAWQQRVNGVGTGRSQLVEDLTSIWKKVTGNVEEVTKDFAWMDTFEEVDAFFEEVKTAYQNKETSGVIVDVETNQKLDPWDVDSKLVCIGFSYKPGHARAIKIHHKDEVIFSNYGQPMWEAFVRKLQGLFDSVPCGGWNFKFDVKWIKEHTSTVVKDVFFDGHLAHYLIYNMDGKRHDLKSVIVEELGTPIPEAALYADFQRLKSEGYPKEEVHMGNVHSEILLNYVCGDVESTYRLYEHLEPLLDNDQAYKPEEFRQKHPGFSTRKVYQQIMLPSVLELAETEENGIKTDKNMLDYLLDTYPSKLERLYTPILKTSWVQSLLPELGEKDKPDKIVLSYVWLSKLLYDVIRFPANEKDRKTRKAKGGQVQVYYKTGKPIREKLKQWAAQEGRHDLADFITSIEAYKKAVKLFTSYVSKMSGFTQDHGYLRTNYNIAGTATGRASTSKPSLHIIPKKSDLKKIFVSRWHEEGGLILQSDFSQLEMRIVAAIAKDQNLIDIFKKGTDTHREMAAQIFKKPSDLITDDERSRAKTIAFGILYGMQPAAMAWRTGLSVDECKAKIDNFFDSFPDLAKWMKKQKNDAAKRAVIRPNTGRKQKNKKTGKEELVEFLYDRYGYITTVFGRQRIIPEAAHWDYGLASKADRKAFNTPIQSAASDVAYEALIRIQQRIRKAGLKSKVFGWIHDSIEVDTHPTEVFQVYQIMIEEMEQAPPKLYRWLTAPVKVSMEMGHGWGYMVEVKLAYLTEGVLELEGDEASVYSVYKSMSMYYDIDVLEEGPVVKQGKATGYKMKFQSRFRTDVQ
jgi:DNA polymerase I-like protein with 3'-5' exonuclease and polymerase domains